MRGASRGRKGFGCGFERGWEQLSIKELRGAREEIMHILNIKRRESFIAYKKGRIEMRAQQAVEVTELFHSYGVVEVWDTEEKEKENEYSINE